jgi:predicted cupin superfamily sugar epimerase
METLIKKHDLAPHPEGGHFKEIYRSSQRVRSDLAPGRRNAVTHIYFLLKKGEISRFHRVVHDEIWNFYEGAPLQLIQFDANGIKTQPIGPGCNAYTAIVPGGAWQAAATTGRYSLVGCTVAPGFDFADFSFLKDSPQERERFQAEQTGFAHFL